MSRLLTIAPSAEKGRGPTKGKLAAKVGLAAWRQGKGAR